jgi:pimeloyl-ACP methyl ester carboxylesterase
VIIIGWENHGIKMLNYETDGSGTPLLLIHGFGISFNIWLYLRPILRDHFTLIMVELPGIGRSPAPLDGKGYLDAAVEGIEDVRCLLEIEKWHVLSFSSGTHVGERYVSKFTVQVQRAIFLCPACTNKSKANSLRIAKDFGESNPKMADWVLSGWRLRFLIHLFGFSLKPSSYLPEWSAEFGSQPVGVLKATLWSLPGHGAQIFEPMPVPSLFICGTQDFIVDAPRRPAENERLIRAAHSAPVTEPGEVAQAVLPFLLGK